MSSSWDTGATSAAGLLRSAEPALIPVVTASDGGRPAAASCPEAAPGVSCCKVALGVLHALTAVMLCCAESGSAQHGNR